jgi:hypothetical protein
MMTENQKTTKEKMEDLRSALTRGLGQMFIPAVILLMSGACDSPEKPSGKEVSQSQAEGASTRSQSLEKTDNAERNPVQISAGGGHTCVLFTDETINCLRE